MKLPLLSRRAAPSPRPAAFDARKPFDVLPPLPPDYDFDQIPILKQVNLSNIALSKLDALATKLPNLFLLMHPLLVRESVASSGIENINTTVQEVFEAEVMPEKQTGAAKEVLHYREAMLEGLKFVAKGTLETRNILALQKLVEPERAGIRTRGVHLKNERTEEVFYTPPQGEKRLRQLLTNLEKYIREDWDDIDPLIKTVVIHYQFEAIHPFLDGNGRVGRMLMILYLILKERLRAPVLFLSGYIERKKSEYYRLLRHVTKSHDFGPFVLYMLKGIEEQANETVKTVARIEELMHRTEGAMKRKMPHAHDLVLCLFSRPLLSIDYVQESLALSARQTASKYLTTLTDLGILRERKVGRQKIFYSTEFLHLLS